MWIVTSQCGFDLHSLVTSAFEHLYLCIFTTHISSLVKRLFKPFAYFFQLDFMFSCCFQSILHVLETCALSEIIWNIFFQSWACPFIILQGSIKIQTREYEITMKLTKCNNERRTRRTMREGLFTHSLEWEVALWRKLSERTLNWKKEYIIWEVYEEFDGRVQGRGHERMFHKREEHVQNRRISRFHSRIHI